MVDLQTVLQSNSRLQDVKDPQVALFVGATSGIGLGILKEFARNSANPRVYIVARNATAAAPLAEELRLMSPGGHFEIIGMNVSLIKDAEKVAEFIKSKESSLDLLCMSVGFFSLDGRQGECPRSRSHYDVYLSILDTTEGLDASLTTRHYSRIRIAQLLLPLLNQSKSPHVLSILAGGEEGPIHEDDLGLDNPKNFSVSSGNSHAATMMTFALEHLASENPRISFVHAFPGIVATPLFGKIAGGVLGMVLRYIVAPVLKLFLRSVSEAGQRGLFMATSARYSVDDGIVPLAEGSQKAQRTEGGIFTINEHGETADNAKILEDFRKRGVDKKIWDHTMEVFAVVSSR
jgi:NAD(P)-dependent dehydrogenase (short-subunit alcohol dehydrogenase family)